ncbi:MAG: phage integrase N-terminal SAM-like domain-containing protein [Prolixibacteraceae bacterium]|nr:phage integrase N-terminal SAM-like domain-containing protein [Prolixibacteraceae bacterium]
MTNRPQIKLENGEHRRIPVVWVRFDYNQNIIKRLKATTPAGWSQSTNCWYIIKEEFNLNKFFNNLKELAFIDYSALKKSQETIAQKHQPLKKARKTLGTLPPGFLEKLEQERYSPNTIKIYSHYFREFVSEFNDKALENISKEEINTYLLRLIREKNISSSQQNQRINAIKFYFEKVLQKDKQFYWLERPRKERKLPDVLSKEEIAEMIKSTE